MEAELRAAAAALCDMLDYQPQCSHCNGLGRLNRQDCGRCEGTGLDWQILQAKRRVEVALKAKGGA